MISDDELPRAWADVDDDALLQLVLRYWLAVKRSRLQMANSAPPGAPVAERLNRKRYARSQLSAEARRLRGSSKPPIPKDILAFRYRPHAVLTALLKARERMWRSALKRDRWAAPSQVSLKRLSFLDAPEETLDCLSKLTAIEATALKAQIDFDFEYVEDVGPFLVMQDFWHCFAPVFTGGTIYPAVQKVLFALGLSRPLGMHFPTLRSLKDVWALPVQRRRSAGSTASDDRYLEPQTSEIAADRLVDEINIWLDAAVEAELTEQGRGNIKSMITELLDNAERHSSYENKDGSWSLAAFMAKRPVNGEMRFLCYFAILSTGSSIEESLRATAPPELREKLENFVEAMRISKARQSDETLITLAALQDGVTRDERAYEAGSGGYGFMHFVDAVNILGLSGREELRPKITIISGRSCIRLKDRYIRGVRREGEAVRRLLFNPSNSLGEAPDDQFVHDLPIRLPGTVISVGFTLDPDFYRTTLNAGD